MPAPRLRRAALALPPLLAVGLLVPQAASTSAPAAAATTPLNVVLVLTDDQTLGSLAKMPYLSSQQWIDFPNAVIENGLCCPSRATVLTGQYDTHTGVTHNAQVGDFDPRETLATALQRRGYRTGLIGKYLNMYDGSTVPPGWDDWQVPYSTTLYNQYRYPLSNNGKREWRGSTPADYQLDLLTTRGQQFIATSAAQRKPFFMMFAPTATHTPWKASPAREGMYASEPVVRSPSFNEADASDKPLYIRKRPMRDGAAMDASRRKEWEAARSTDDALQRLDSALETAGVKDSTVVIYMTDNGYALGEHRWVTKRCEYDECLRTPLLVRYPGQAARKVPQVASNIDIAPTVLSIAGATTTRPVDGASLLPFLDPAAAPAPTAWREGALIHWPGGNTTGLSGKPDSIPQFWGIRTAKDKYVELDTGEKEYYDLVADPHELVNLLSRPTTAAQKTRVATLERQLDALKVDAGAAALPLNTSMPAPGVLGPDLD